MRIGIDIDDVLYPWYATAHALSEEAGITNGVTPCTWTPSDEYGIDRAAWLDVLAAATIDGRLYGADPIPGVTEQLQRLEDSGHSIHLVTARGFLRPGHTIRAHTAHWLEQHQIPHHSLTYSADKTVVLVDAFVDDNARNYDDLVASSTATWLLEAQHNAADRPGRRTVPTLEAFIDQALGVATAGPQRPAGAPR